MAMELVETLKRGGKFWLKMAAIATPVAMLVFALILGLSWWVSIVAGLFVGPSLATIFLLGDSEGDGMLKSSPFRDDSRRRD